MGMLARALGDHLKEVAWVLFLIFLFLGSLFLIFGRHLGCENIIWICLGFVLIVAALFMMIILGELFWIGIVRVFKTFKPGG